MCVSLVVFVISLISTLRSSHGLHLFIAQVEQQRQQKSKPAKKVKKKSKKKKKKSNRNSDSDSSGSEDNLVNQYLTILTQKKKGAAPPETAHHYDKHSRDTVSASRSHRDRSPDRSRGNDHNWHRDNGRSQDKNRSSDQHGHREDSRSYARGRNDDGHNRHRQGDSSLDRSRSKDQHQQRKDNHLKSSGRHERNRNNRRSSDDDESRRRAVSPQQKKSSSEKSGTERQTPQQQGSSNEEVSKRVYGLIVSMALGWFISLIFSHESLLITVRFLAGMSLDRLYSWLSKSVLKIEGGKEGEVRGLEFYADNERSTVWPNCCFSISCLTVIFDFQVFLIINTRFWSEYLTKV